MCGSLVVLRLTTPHPPPPQKVRNYPNTQDLYVSWSFMFKRHRADTLNILLRKTEHLIQLLWS